MRCNRCGKNRAKYEIEFFVGLRKGKELLCDACYEAGDWGEEKGIRVRLLPDRSCPECGCTLDDYVRTGLVGCAGCYRTFRSELLPYIAGMQAGTEHVGGTPPSADKQEVVRELLRMFKEKERAEKEGDEAQSERLAVRIAEWQSLLFGDEE